MGPEQIFDIADKIGTMVLIIGLGYFLLNKKLVLGWVYENLEKECAELRALLNAHASRTEARVDKLEQERDKRYDPAT